MSRYEHVDTRLELAILLSELRCCFGGRLVFDLKLSDLVREVSYRIFKLGLSMCGRNLRNRRSGAVVLDSLVQGLASRLKLGNANRSNSSGCQILDHPQFFLAKPPVIEHTDQADGTGRASQRIERIRIGIGMGIASLEPKENVAGVSRITEGGGAAAGY
jgi:hypothetical protein